MSLTQKQALRWLGNFIKLHGLRSPDKMYVYRQTDLWGILDAHPRAEKMHLQVGFCRRLCLRLERPCGGDCAANQLDPQP